MEYESTRQTDHAAQMTMFTAVHGCQESQTEYAVWMHSEKTQILIRYEFFIDDLKVIEVLEWLNVFVDEIDILLTATERQLKDCHEYQNKYDLKVKSDSGVATQNDNEEEKELIEQEEKS